MGKKDWELGKLKRIPDDKRYYDESDFVKEVIEKINMIIDHLNSQDQEGYEKRIRIRGELSGETEHIKAHKEYLTTSKEDTPEEWKEVNKDIWYMVGGKKYVNINGEEYVRTSDIEKLLSKLTTK